MREQIKFADAVCPQSQLVASKLAPKQISTPEFAFNVNYGYHLDAGKFADFLHRHCVEKLGVVHVSANMTSSTQENGDIASISTDIQGDIEGDLFIDCTGSRALLLGEHFNIPWSAKIIIYLITLL